MKSMVEILAHYAETQPDQLYAADNAGNEFSYAQAWAKVKNYAAYLSQVAGVKADDRIMVECNQEVHYLLMDHACVLLGAIFVPIENNASTDRKTSICEETACSLWIYSTKPLEGVKSICYSDILSYDGVYEVESFPESEAVAQILYTTGTTGKSKGIVITHKANVALAENIKYGVDMKPGNTELIPVPLSHSHGLRCSYANLLNGGAVVLIDGLLRVKDVFALIEKYSVTALDLSPSAAIMLIKLSKGKFWQYGRKLHYIQLGTAALPEGLKAQLIEELPGVHLYNFYGSTESGRSCVLDFSIEQGRTNCIGKPSVNATIVFTDDDRNIISSSAENPGLLASTGAMNMVGYWKNEELTAEILRDNYIFTNDLGYIDDEGYVYVLGRRDDVINCNGIKISPDEIEEVATQFDDVRDAACVPIADPTAGQLPRLFIAVDDEETFDLKGFKAFLTEHLDSNKFPKRIEFIEEVPRTYNGKIQRKKLI